MDNMGKRKADGSGDSDWDIAACHYYFMASRRTRLDDNTNYCNVGFEVFVLSSNE
jgi:hypothetical protein